jgi:beta-1,4-N-acetylglucosaminyltransferase
VIFIATGTTGFDELVRCADKSAPEWNEEVIVQIGEGDYIPRNIEYFRFAPSLEDYYQRASLIIAHGGLGICSEVLSRGLPLIGVSNPDRYDDHQQDLLKAFEKENYLILASVETLSSAVKKARKTTFRKYSRPPVRIHLVIGEFLNNLEKK